MPVFFRGNSEYDRNYGWNQSYRSASFSPNLEQSATDAGLRSDQIGSVNGARITSKKKAWHRAPQVQYCLSWWPESDADSHTLDTDNHAAQTLPNNGSPVIKAHKKLRRKKDSAAKTDSKHRDITKNNVKKQKESAEVAVIRSSPKKIRTSSGLVTRHERTKTPTTAQNNRSLSGIKQKPETKMNSPKKKQRTLSHDQPTATGNSENPTHSDRNIPLEHRAGLNANKPTRKSRARLSEYQRNFAAPKFSTKPSPILSALDVVHTSSSAIPPHSGVQFHQASEYISKYRSPISNRKQDQLSLSPGSPSLKLKVKEMQKPYSTQKSKKSFRSEYAAQYEPNCEFEVGELRKIAEDNKQKHEGTHIDPEHATQVISPFNKLWEVSTDGGTEPSETNATDETETKVDQGSVKENDSEEKWSKISQKGSDSVEDMTEEDKCTANETDSLENEPSEISKSSTVRKLAWNEEADHEDTEELSQNSRESASVLEGRVSTPRLQEIGGALRTHHDLTTPSIGGALLISPKSAKQQPGSEDSSVILDRLQPKTAGSPTYDSHLLLKGRLHHLIRSSPQPPSSQRSPSKRDPSPTKTPPPKTPQKSKSSSKSPKVQRHARTMSATRAPIRGALRSEEFQHCGRLQTAPALIQQNDDDALSVASSLTSARATELLQRAKQRKSFWTTT